MKKVVLRVTVAASKTGPNLKQEVRSGVRKLFGGRESSCVVRVFKRPKTQVH